MLVTNKQWFLQEPKENETPEQNLTKNIRRVWEGLFYSKYLLCLFYHLIVVVWHSDKPQYQQSCCEKIASIMNQLQTSEHKKIWFEGFIHIFNLHWDKVDNYRIDKYLMFLRF